MSEKENNLSVECLNWLDDLSIEEAEALLSEINKVTICTDESSTLRAKALAKVGIKEAKITQKTEERMVVRKWDKGYKCIKSCQFTRRVVACIAVIMTCSVVAIAATNMSALQRFWGDDTEIYNDKALETVQSVQNENVRVNIEGIVSDHYQCVFVFSVEALTREGRRIIKDANKDIPSALKISRTVIGGYEDESSGIFQYTDDNKNKEYKAYRCDFELKNTDFTQPAVVKFDGLTMKFDIPKYMQVITLFPDSESELQSVDLSPIGYYYKASEFAEDVRLINKDGTLDDELGYQGAMSQEANEEVTIIGSFTRLIDLNDYQGIQIDGINYTTKKAME